jgi:hypothetical protein
MDSKEAEVIRTKVIRPGDTVLIRAEVVDAALPPGGLIVIFDGDERHVSRRVLAKIIPREWQAGDRFRFGGPEGPTGVVLRPYTSHAYAYVRWDDPLGLIENTLSRAFFEKYAVRIEEAQS